MTRPIHVLLLFALGACEHESSLPGGTAAAPTINPPAGVSAYDPPRFSAELTETVESPPPPTAEELRVGRLRTWFSHLSMAGQQGVTHVCQWNERNPCGVMLTGGPDPRPAMLASVSTSERPFATAYCDEMYERTVCDTPLVVAFDSEPVSFVDHLPTATTPWLALDRDGDGEITSRSELFGDATILASGARASNGFVALAGLDDNGDGVIDARDAAFARLVLWSDRDGDQRSTPAELRPAAAIVTSIPLANEREVRCTSDDDCEGERGVIDWRGPDGAVRHGALIDVYLHH